ncbi:MAG: ATP-binding protein [Cyanobacteria bacterium P01_E01_bin.42]
MSKKISPSRKLSLRVVLVIPFLLQIFAIVSLISWLAVRNGQKAVEALANQLMEEVGAHIQSNLQAKLDIPHKINQTNLNLVKSNLLPIDNQEVLGRHFLQQVRQFSDVVYVYFGNPQGGMITAEKFRNTNTSKIHLTLDFIKNEYIVYQVNESDEPIGQTENFGFYDATIRPWYTAALKAGEPTWSEIYIDFFTQTPISSAAVPVYNAQGDILGVFSTDILLFDEFDKLLGSLKIRQSGEIFITQRTGELLSSSLSEEAEDKQTDSLSMAIDSSSPLIHTAFTAAQTQVPDFENSQTIQNFTFVLEKQKYFAQVIPFQDERGIDWFIFITVPESDFMAEINAQRQVTVLLGLVALVVATGVGIATARWLTQPLLQLNLAAKDLAAGQLERTVPIDRTDEVGELASAFNSMAKQLKASFTNLEQRVQARTAELAEEKNRADIANRAKSEFLANMSHELRTPLNGVLGYAQILSRSPELSDKSRNGVNTIHQCGSHLLTLINDVLDLAKIEARKLELNPTTVHLPSLLQSVVEMCEIRAHQQQIEFVYQPSDLLPDGVQADEKRLRQVLINLLGNAIKFTQQGQVILSIKVLDLTQDTARLKFQVTDTGVGIAPDDLAKLFEAFEQVGDRAKQSEGTGLGLAISQKIVSLMGSKIEVESKLGQGSQFSFVVELPLVQNWGQQQVFSDTQHIVGYHGKRRHILMIDDRLENRAVVVGLLELLGFEVSEANNGQTGLETMRQVQPDLIILDIAMPVMDGLEFLKHLRQDEQFHEMTVIVSSASVAQADRQMALRAGGDDFLAKPVQMSDLRAVLQEHLALDWIERESSQDQKTENLKSNQPKQPEPEQLQMLLEMAQQGNTRGVRAALSELVNSDPSYRNFADPLLSLTKQFKIEEVEEQLQQYQQQEGDRDD